ncbi:MAG: hypothetical protein DHS20C15_34010 [Planctomycetota bacterium]|nr:MAG: hypothetical protein DHS20C15_34010 [Planctomycetota bacterium]
MISHRWNTLARALCLAALGLCGVACTSAPIASIPAPHPTAGEWTLDSEGGAFLGLAVEANEAGTLEALEAEPGVRVLRVVQNSPAAHQGLRVGDVLLSFAGVKLADPVVLDVLLAKAESGASVPLQVRRGDSVFALDVTLAGGQGGPVAAPELLYVADPTRTLAGWRSTPNGVLLVALAESSPLLAAGFELGSSVTALDSDAVHSAGELVRRVNALPAGARVSFELRDPRGQARTLDARLFEVPTRVTRSRVPVLWDYDAKIDGSATDLHLLDFWFLELFQFRRRGGEREWVLLELFGYELFAWGQGTGELSE